MKKLLILTIASLIGTAGYSQTTKFGIKAGVNLAKYQFKQTGATDPDTKTNTTFNVTGYADAPLAGHFSIQPGVSLQGKGGKVSSVLGEVSQNTMWIEVPVNLVGKLPLGEGSGHSLYLGAGPYAGFGISGKTKVGSAESDVNFGDSASDDIKGTDFGVNFIGGFEMDNGFTLGAGYGMGLTDLRPGGSGGNGKTTNRVWSFSAGFLF